MGKKTTLKRIVLDTNVIASALLFEGPSGNFVNLWKSGRIKPLVSGEILREYARVLSYPKFQLDPEQAHALLTDQVLPYITPVKVKIVPDVITNDPSDNHFLACAVDGKADAIISGDKDLLNLGSYKKIPILSVRESLTRLLANPGFH